MAECSKTCRTRATSPTRRPAQPFTPEHTVTRPRAGSPNLLGPRLLGEERACRVPEHRDAELEVVDGDALVGRMDELRHELRIHGLVREEAVRDRPESCPEIVAVREARARGRRQSRVGLE